MAEEERYEGLTRREVLKKGAILGGALVWATPMVQTVGMAAAGAQTAPDPSPRECLGLKLNPVTPVTAGVLATSGWVAGYEVCNCGTVDMNVVFGSMNLMLKGTPDTIVSLGSIPFVSGNHGTLDYPGKVAGDPFVCDFANSGDGPFATPGVYYWKATVQGTSAAPGNPVIHATAVSPDIPIP